MVASRFEKWEEPTNWSTEPEPKDESKSVTPKKPARLQNEELPETLFGGSGAKSHRGEGCEG